MNVRVEPSMSLTTLVLRYAAFAVIASLANLAAQRLVFLCGTGTVWFVLALGTGTGVGLVIKYILDKNWIFYDQSTGVGAHSQKFPLYVAMGLVTTALFWAMETLPWLLWHSAPLRDAGAVLGLTIGYVIKYRLDRRFVFTDARLAGAGGPA